MNPRVKQVLPNEDFTLKLTFENNEEKVFDVKPYFHIGVFKTLNEFAIFKNVKPFLGTIKWESGQDFCPDTLYLESV